MDFPKLLLFHTIHSMSCIYIYIYPNLHRLKVAVEELLENFDGSMPYELQEGPGQIPFPDMIRTDNYRDRIVHPV